MGRRQDTCGVAEEHHHRVAKVFVVDKVVVHELVRVLPGVDVVEECGAVECASVNKSLAPSQKCPTTFTTKGPISITQAPPRPCSHLRSVSVSKETYLHGKRGLL